MGKWEQGIMVSGDHHLREVFPAQLLGDLSEKPQMGNSGTCALF